MTTAGAGTPPEGNTRSDFFYYLLALLFGALAGWVDIRVGDLLFTAMIVLAGCMLMGFLRPRKPWRWILMVGACVPIAQLLAYCFLSQKRERAQIYESFLAFMPGVAGAYGGAIGRGVVNNLFKK